MTNCSIVSIPVPSQEKLHKQWCLFDQTENIDFDQEVRKITKTDPDEENRDLEILSDLSPSESQASYHRRALELEPLPLFEDLRSIQSNFDFGKKKRQTNNKNQRNHSQSKRVTRVSKNISVRRH